MLTFHPNIPKDLEKKVTKLLGGKKKAFQWFNTVNPFLGYVRPVEMILHGRTGRLRTFIDDAVSRSAVG